MNEKILKEELKNNFLKPTDITDKNLSTSIRHPERKEVDYAIVSDHSSNIDPFGLYSSSASESDLSNERLIKRWRQLILHPIANECITKITNEAINMEDDMLLLDTNKINDKLGDKVCKKIEESFDKILRLMNFKKNASKYFMQFYIDGQLNFEAIYEKSTKTGIQRLEALSPLGLIKTYNIDTKRMGWVYNVIMDDINSIRYNNYITGMDGASETVELSDEQVIHTNSGIWDNTRKMYLSLIQYAMRSINQLYLVEDSMVMYRLTHAADVKVFSVDTGKMNRDRAEMYVNELKNLYENKQSYNSNTGTIDSQKQVRVYGENYWFPKNSDGKGTTVDILTGSNFNLGDMVDLQYFQNQVYNSFGIPQNKRNIGNDSAGFDWSTNGTANITKDEIEFFKLIKNIRTNFSYVILDAIKKDLVSQKAITEDQWNDEIVDDLEFQWKNDNEFYQMKKLQVLLQKIDVLNAMGAAKDEGYFTKDWIAEEVLGFTREEWEKMQTPAYAEKDIDFADKDINYYKDTETTDTLLKSEKISIKRNQKNLDSLIEKYDLGEGDEVTLDENTEFEKKYIVKDKEMVLNG